MKAIIKLKDKPSIQGENWSFDPGREIEASIHRGSWSFRLGQTARCEQPSIQGRGLSFDHGGHGFRSRNGMPSSIQHANGFDPEKVSPSIWGVIPAKICQRNKMQGLGIEPQALRSCAGWVSLGYVCSKCWQTKNMTWAKNPGLSILSRMANQR